MQQHAALQKLWAMIQKHGFAMMTTQESAEALRSRPMTTIDRDFDGSLWFFAKTDSAAVKSLEAHPQVSLSYSAPVEFEFVAVSGIAVVVTDVAKKQELWRPTVQAWFPEGAESPHNVLIKVIPNHAEYWDSKSNLLVQLFKIPQ